LDATAKQHPPDFYKGLDLFNREFYYECHDVWEEVWGEAKGKEKIFYQALIMAAVSLYHFGNENLEGALSCYQKALNRFRQLPGRYLSLNVADFVKALEEFYAGISVKESELTEALRNKHRPKIQLEESD
jgi:predicted metal-dependent hydrolase